MSDIPLYKISVGGDEAVGKTSLIRRYCEGKFETSRVATIGVDFQTKIVELPSGAVKLSIWDMAGQARFEIVRTGMYRGSRAVALVFDLSNPETLAHLPAWHTEAMTNAKGTKILVVGNKLDLAQTRGAGKPARNPERAWRRCSSPWPRWPGGMRLNLSTHYPFFDFSFFCSFVRE
jgi:small GTP-binding protein